MAENDRALSGDRFRVYGPRQISRKRRGDADRPGWLPDNTQGKPTAPGRVLLDDLRKPKNHRRRNRPNPGAATACGPMSERSTDIFRAIVHTNIDRLATPPNNAFQRANDPRDGNRDVALPIPCSRQSSETTTPFPPCRKITRTRPSLHRDFFIAVSTFIKRWRSLSGEKAIGRF